MKKKMKQSKLLLMLNVFSGILALLVLVLLIQTINTSKIADNANYERTQLTDYAMRFINTSGFLTGEARAYSSTGNITHYNNYITEVNTTKTRELCIDGMIANGLSEDGITLINKMQDISDALIPQEEASMKLAEQGDYRNASLGVLNADYNEKVTELANAKLELIEQINTRTNKEVGPLVAATRAMEGITAIACLLLIILQVVNYYIVHKQVIKPIIIVEREARRIAKGDLSHDIELEADTSEIGMLVNSMQITKWELKKYIVDISDKLSKMADRDLSLKTDVEYIGDFAPIQTSMARIIENLNHSFSVFEEASVQVAEAATESAQQAEIYADSSIKQNESIQEVSTAIAQITVEIRESADKAQMATTLANRAGVALGSSNEQLQGMLAAMNEISDASGEIGKIIKTIEDIAFQTNILALNAAVEAARAGVAGKGFAVVADEVRNLATKSSDASKVTSSMIENSLNTIQSGAKIAKSASNTFVEVMVDAGKAAQAMGSIYERSKIQATTIAQINSGMDHISESVKQNATLAEISATSSEELAGQAESLKEEIGQFNLLPSSYR